MSELYTNLLWTGGWDSTFRLLQLLVVEKRVVQPHYLVFPENGNQDKYIPVRRSTTKEVDTMNDLANRIISQFPSVRDQLLPLKFYNVSTISEQPVVTKSYKELAGKIHIGNQYEWLTRFAYDEGLNNLELSVERDDNYISWLTIVKEYLVTDSDKKACVLDCTKAPNYLVILFSPFSFPIVEYRKKDMHDFALENQWMDILHHTWFCHRPVAGKYACGGCNPCIIVIKEGMGWRIPIFFRIVGPAAKKTRNALYTIRHKIKKIFKNKRSAQATELNSTRPAQKKSLQEKGQEFR